MRSLFLLFLEGCGSDCFSILALVLAPAPSVAPTVAPAPTVLVCVVAGGRSVRHLYKVCKICPETGL